MAKLKIHRDTAVVKEFVLNNDLTTIGRAPNNNLILSDPIISRCHAQISREADGYILTDLDSSDGTYINGKKLQPRTPRLLANGDTIDIGHFELQFCLKIEVPTQRRQPSSGESTIVINPFSITRNEESELLERLVLRGLDILTIGRDADNDTVIDYPVVSRFHAQIRRKEGSFYLIDLNSSNGTFINGKQIEGKRILRAGDVIRIGPCRLTLNVDETIIKQNEEGNLRLDAIHLNKVVGKGTNLLNDISLSIQARQFVVIAGVSGGGKSTLVDALNGFRPATSGKVLVNGIDLYKNFNAYRADIGYVPQKDIVHMELTVEQALDYGAQLRMPPDTTLTERQKRVDEVLEDLGLTHRRDVPVKALSGGQLKRVSIGVELLTKPNLFFLDEATSGLDPGTEADIMQLLRKLADQGRTILLITHATENVMLCDLVVFLAKGGNLAYFGPPQEASAYFGVSKFNEIYSKVERENSPQEWQQDYLRSPQYQKYVVQKQRPLETLKTKGKSSRLRQQLPGAQVKGISSWRQFLILSKRNLAILMRDRASLFLMLAIAPILGLLDFVTWKRNLLDIRNGDFGLTITMLFVTTLIAVMVGSLSTMREIVKEQEVYRRERMIFLKIIPYLLSKVWVSVLLALYQVAIFVLFKILAVDIPTSTDFLLSMYITLVLATIAGMVMGLLVSAISPNQNIAPLLTIIFLVPQITFGGGVLPINTLGPPGQAINSIALTKWPFESLVTLTEIGKDVAEDPCWQKSEKERKNLSDEEQEKCKCLGPNVLKQCQFPGIESKYDPVVDSPQPEKPQEPGDPPERPQKPKTQSWKAQQDYEKSLDNYQDELENYQKKVDEYQEKIDQWQEEYSEWKGKYESTIGEAEGIIGRFHQDYGSMFDVNVTKHWGIEGFLIAVMFGLLLGIQKRKDII